MRPPVNIMTTKGCNCGANLTFTASDEPLRGVSFAYDTRGATVTIHAKAHCLKCGALFDPDHERFSGDFNEAVHRVVDS